MSETDDVYKGSVANPYAEILPQKVFQLAVEQAAVAITITDPDARILYANPAFEKVTGYSIGEVAGLNQSILSYKVTPRLVYDSLWAQLERKQPWKGVLVNRRKDGSRYLADLTITPVLNAEGDISHYLGMQRDVTDVHRLEHQVNNQQALIESALDATQAAMVTLDDSLVPVLRNRSFLELEQKLEKGFINRVIERLQQLWPEQFCLENVFSTGFSALEIDLQPLDKAQPLWFSCSGSAVNEQDASAEGFYDNKSSQYLLITLQDITDLKQQQTQLHLSDLQALLQEQERIRSVRETLSGAIYQLERPLNMINAAARLVSRRSQIDPQGLLHLFKEVQSAGQQTLTTLSACLPEPHEEATTLVNVNEVLRNTLSLLTPRLLAAGIVVEWQPEVDLPGLPGKPTELTTLFKLLLDNATEAMIIGRSEIRELYLQTRSAGSGVEIIIQDTGPGIDKNKQLKVFEPFYTTHPPGKGHLGMGFTLAQDIVNKHQGTLEIDPGYTRGCRIKVQICHA
ncbi:nitrogen fixation negative regulator NifL [Oceanospirillum sediminis]|uniref:histidine kinase n=1 Tax=Oceanospirillum sediminis TaxID=2760088 RepID=A0A839IP89_9GAMM|nr:nitrogen fixation negative regulator NifL [Oceanospirillum sediminis]MBB1486490.1 nitrogen fixation negative regulator NifL [Oceanospirillum sediminis]